MHSVKLPKHVHAISWGLCIAVVCLSGCRSGRGSERTVRVTETAPPVAPARRDASVKKPGAETGRLTDAGRNDERKRGILAGARLPGQKEVPAKEPGADAKMSLSDQTPPPPTQTRAERVSKAKPSTAQESVGSLVSASLNDLDDSLSVAPKAKTPSTAVATKTPKDVSELAASDRSTKSPQAIELALRESLADLPELSEANTVPSGLTTRRIGAAETENAATAQSSSRAGDLVAQTTGAATQKSQGVTSANEEVVPVSHDGRSKTTMRTAHALETISESTDAGTPSPTEELTEAELFDKLLDIVQRPVTGESPAERERRMIVARHLMVLAGRPVTATESMEGMNDSDRQYLKHQLLGLWTMIDPQGHPSSGRRITEALPQFREATRFLAEATDSLRLSNIEFCTEIEAYGQVKPFDGNRFDAGQQVILYCEVENFIATEVNGSLQTRLRGTYDVYDASGTKVVSQLLPVDEQTSRNHLRDYFLAYQMNLPAQLTTGSYRMQLTIEDVIGKKYGQAEIPFEIK
ncbi:MAG: hypothetical protein AAFX06_05795 [Planctomycetota bacterium]